MNEEDEEEPRETTEVVGSFANARDLRFHILQISSKHVPKISFMPTTKQVFAALDLDVIHAHLLIPKQKLQKVLSPSSLLLKSN
jgi:hypothetical protein